MAQIQYNKTFLMQVDADLKIRRNALPVLQSKEAALRAELRRLRLKIRELDQKIAEQISLLDPLKRLWVEMPEILKVEKVNFLKKKIASIDVMLVESVLFSVEEFSLFSAPAWFVQGLEFLKEVFRLKIERLNMDKVLESVEYARRKTTQKVNLYEKVQIPFFEESIRKIKRFLEDEENLSKSSQKVLKKRMEEVGVL